jgi:hypothetical protein
VAATLILVLASWLVVRSPGAGCVNIKDPAELEAKAAARLAESEQTLLEYLPAYQTALIVV